MRGMYNRIRGKLMGLTVGGKFIACETDSTMAFERDMLPASAITEGTWSRYLPGKKRWSMTVDGYLLRRSAGADFKTLYMSFFNDEEVTIKWRTREGVDQFLIFEGNAFVLNGTASAPSRGYANWNITFQGNGILNMDWEEFFTIINALPANSDQPTYFDTTQWK